MPDKIDTSLILEHLKALQEGQSEIKRDIHMIAADMRNLKTHMGAFMKTEVLQDASLAELQERLKRVERRLELRD